MFKDSSAQCASHSHQILYWLVLSNSLFRICNSPKWAQYSKKRPQFCFYQFAIRKEFSKLGNIDYLATVVEQENHKRLCKRDILHEHLVYLPYDSSLFTTYSGLFFHLVDKSNILESYVLSSKHPSAFSNSLSYLISNRKKYFATQYPWIWWFH